MKRALVIAHGWAGSGEVFKPLIEHLKNTSLQGQKPLQIFSLEQHYFGQNQACLIDFVAGHELPPSLLEDPNTEWIGLGHSLGFAKLLSMNVQWSALISLHGFTRFAIQKAGQNGTPMRIMERMIKQFKINPHLVLDDFWRRSGHRPEKQTREISERLLQDLQWMQTLDMSECLNERLMVGCSLLSIESPLDPIVNQKLSDECFAEESRCPESTPLKRVSLETSHEGLTQWPERYTAEITDFLRSTIEP